MLPSRIVKKTKQIFVICNKYFVNIIVICNSIMSIEQKQEKEYKFVYDFQKEDTRDYKYISHLSLSLNPTITTVHSKVTIGQQISIPSFFSLRSIMSPILNQGSIGTCVSNAFALCIATMTKKNVKPSRLFHYAVSRILTNTVLTDDSGLYIRDACNTITKYGVCQEVLWDYNDTKYDILPPLNAFQNARYFKKFLYTFINQDLISLKQCLVTNKTPIIFGFMVYDSFMKDNVVTTGIVPYPNIQTESLLGGHCMLIIGFDDVKQNFICANSWGTSWGDKGFCYIPYTYLTDPNLASDFCYTQFIY